MRVGLRDPWVLRAGATGSADQSNGVTVLTAGPKSKWSWVRTPQCALFADPLCTNYLCPKSNVFLLNADTFYMQIEVHPAGGVKTAFFGFSENKGGRPDISHFMATSGHVKESGEL